MTETVGGPTVVIVLDRVDLVEQTARQFMTAGLPTLRVAGTKEVATADDRRGSAWDHRDYDLSLRRGRASLTIARTSSS